MSPRAPMVRATFRVPPQLWHAAQRRADERGENMSEIIREALKRYTREQAMSRIVPNTDALVAWCGRHGLDASEIPHEIPERERDRSGAFVYRFRRMLPDGPPKAEPRWGMVEVVTADEMPSLWRVED